MPIVSIEVVVDVDRELERGLAQSLADAVGRTLNSPPGQTWVRLRTLGRDRYAENGSSVDDSELPVFVTVLERHCPVGSELQAEVAALTEAIAQVVRRPTASVHLEYAPSAAGRISFGGKLVQ
jgi:phenylpyruvate tautomerase PptA (4-oxalocrotonate tautomerase family)